MGHHKQAHPFIGCACFKYNGIEAVTDKMKAGFKYAIIFIILVLIEVFIALFVHDGFFRPYFGDVLIVAVIYCFIRIFIPSGIKLLQFYVFLFTVAVEIGQYFDYVTLLGLSNIRFFRILLGTSFSWYDILCYAAGGVLVVTSEAVAARLRNGSRSSV